MGRSVTVDSSVRKVTANLFLSRVLVPNPQQMNAVNSVPRKFSALIRFDRKTNSRFFVKQQMVLKSLMHCFYLHLQSRLHYEISPKCLVQREGVIFPLLMSFHDPAGEGLDSFERAVRLSFGNANI